MREIKFRAWFTMYQGKGPVTVYAGDVANFYLGQNMAARIGGVLMQYTGLKDKNGREIYEGDIVRVIAPEGERQGDRWIVEWVNCGFKLHWAEEGDLPEWDRWIDITPIVSVIGNIYENHDLLNT